MSAIATQSHGTLTARDRRIYPAPGAAPRESTLTGTSTDIQRKRFLFDGGYIDIEVPSWLAPTADALVRLLSLPRGWDSYGAPLVKQANVLAAISLAQELMNDRTPSPAVVPTSSGGVQLEWHTRGIDLEIEVRSPVQISVCFEDHRKDETWDAAQLFDFRRLRGVLRDMAQRQP